MHHRASDLIVTLAWVLTGLILWVPANLLPIAIVSQFGNAHESLLITGALRLWNQGMPGVALLVGLGGTVAPLLVLLALTALLAPIALGRPAGRLRFLLRWLHVLELCSIPELHVLAVLVAFIRLDSFGNAAPAAGLWCYTVMSLALLIAWRRFDIDAVAVALTTEKIRTPST